MVIPKGELHYSKIVGRRSRLVRGKKRVNQATVLNYITDANYKKIKQRLRDVISTLKQRNLFPVLQQVNTIIRGVSNYYSFGNNKHRLDYLRYYIDRTF